MSGSQLSDGLLYESMVEGLENDLAKANKLATKRGARLQKLRASMRETEWYNFVQYEYPEAKDWFDEDEVPR